MREGRALGAAGRAAREEDEQWVVFVDVDGRERGRAALLGAREHVVELRDRHTDLDARFGDAREARAVAHDDGGVAELDAVRELGMPSTSR